MATLDLIGTLMDLAIGESAVEAIVGELEDDTLAALHAALEPTCEH